MEMSQEQIQDVVLWIASEESGEIKETYPEDGEKVFYLEAHRTGAMIIKLKVEPSKDFKRWIMQYGSHMEVIEPKDLREEIKKEAQDMIKRYKLME